MADVDDPRSGEIRYQVPAAGDRTFYFQAKRIDAGPQIFDAYCIAEGAYS